MRIVVARGLGRGLACMHQSTLRQPPTGRAATSAPRRSPRTPSTIAGAASPSKSHDIYSLDPKVYDIAFSFRDFEAESAFIVEAHTKFATSPVSGLSSFLEVGCGPARHALLLAQSGIAKRSVGVDLSPEMVEYASARAKELGLEGRTAFVVADMADTINGIGGNDGSGFTRAVVDANDGGLYDAAAIMLGTFSHCLDNDSACAALRNIAECVKPGGILVMELGNPRDVYQGSFCMDGFVNVWEIGEHGDVDFLDEGDDDFDEEGEDDGEGELDMPSDDDLGDDLDDDLEEGFDDELRVMVEYGREGDHFDVERGLLDRTVGFSLFDGGELASSSTNLVTQRQYTLQEIDLLARLSGWRLGPDAVFGDFSFDISLTDDEADRMIVVLSRI